VEVLGGVTGTHRLQNCLVLDDQGTGIEAAADEFLLHNGSQLVPKKREKVDLSNMSETVRAGGKASRCV
jgi:hypothetical protein